MTRLLLSTLVLATGATVVAAAVVVPGTAGRPAAVADPPVRSGTFTRPAEVTHPPGSAVPGSAGPAPGARVAAPGQHQLSARAGPASTDRARWRWPIRPRPPLVRPFRAPPTPYAAGHRGLDLATVDGAVVLAVEGGTVTHAGTVAGRGTVTVAHSGGLSSTYEPVRAVVSVGEVVSAGAVLGTVSARDGPAHCGARVCLHLGARRAEAYLDPHPLLAGGWLALLPLR
ncbi:MAG TPA: M23 family metallopeptidase [Ornithinibacter sp.]|nr:M23 family metallopeptidase [Ornithinibacter sp.]